MLRFLGALFTSLRRGVEFVLLHWCGVDLAAMRAQRVEQQRQAAEAEEAREHAEAQHAELLEATRAQTPETVLLREAIETAPVPVTPDVPKPKSISQRRAEIVAQSRSHDVEIRSSTWLDDEPTGPLATVLKVA